MLTILDHRRTRPILLAAGLALTLTSTAALAATMPDAIYPFPANAGTSDVKQALNKRGFTDVRSVEKSGNIYTADAEWDGKRMMLRIDGKTGAITTHDQDTGMSVGQINEGTTLGDIRQRLHGLGYTLVGEIDKNGGVYETMAYNKMGHHVRLNIDEANGGVRESGAGDSAIAMPKDTMSPQYLQQQLAKLGYDEVRDVSKSGRIYKLEARRNGTWHDLRVDGANGGVTVMGKAS